LFKPVQRAVRKMSAAGRAAISAAAKARWAKVRAAKKWVSIQTIKATLD
jgi:hypothetical protein